MNPHTNSLDAPLMDDITSATNGGMPADSDAWKAVQHRDRRFDGHFFYGVETTGIFCRPSCPARRPRREHVVFFGSIEDAKRAGFRACRRCRPTSDAASGAEEAIEKARSFLEAHRDETVTLEVLAEVAGLSPYHLQRTFKRVTGLSPKEYQNIRRVEAFKEQVGSEKGVVEAAYAAGFGSTRALYEQSGSALGMTPGTYRRGGVGVSIRFTTMPSVFGRVLIAATPRGVCAISLGDGDADLVAELRREYPKAESVVRDDGGMQAWAAPIVRYIEGALPRPDVQIDVAGTDFQRLVWKVLQNIPYGETRTYGEVANMLGRPRSARAVARACAGNKVAILIPCHRIIRGDGSISGYRWGPQRKRRLLDHEQRNAAGGS